MLPIGSFIYSCSLHHFWCLSSRLSRKSFTRVLCLYGPSYRTVRVSFALTRIPVRLGRSAPSTMSRSAFITSGATVMPPVVHSLLSSCLSSDPYDPYRGLFSLVLYMYLSWLILLLTCTMISLTVRILPASVTAAHTCLMTLLVLSLALLLSRVVLLRFILMSLLVQITDIWPLPGSFFTCISSVVPLDVRLQIQVYWIHLLLTDVLDTYHLYWIVFATLNYVLHQGTVYYQQSYSVC